MMIQIAYLSLLSNRAAACVRAVLGLRRTALRATNFLPVRATQWYEKIIIIWNRPSSESQVLAFTVDSTRPPALSYRIHRWTRRTYVAFTMLVQVDIEFGGSLLQATAKSLCDNNCKTTSESLARIHCTQFTHGNYTWGHFYGSPLWNLDNQNLDRRNPSVRIWTHGQPCHELRRWSSANPVTIPFSSLLSLPSLPILSLPSLSSPAKTHSFPTQPSPQYS